MAKKKPEKPRRGRPKLPADASRSARIEVRCTPADKVAIEQAAARAGLSVSAHVVQAAAR